MNLLRTAVVAAVALGLLGLISIRERPGGTPEPALSVTRVQVSYRQQAQCRAVWPRRDWPQASVCGPDEPYLSPEIIRTQAAPGGAVGTRYRPAPINPKPLSTAERTDLLVGPGAVVRYLQQGRPVLVPRYSP